MGLDATRRFIQLCNTSEIPINSTKVFEVGSRRFLVCNMDGQFYAMDDRCTHDNGPLGEGELLEGGEIECPRHGARFDVRTGKALCFPAVGAVSTYSVEERDGLLFVGLPF
jgi:3-phenylpropionate/trans-cinnamate dioxygenase ferredoxin component